MLADTSFPHGSDASLSTVGSLSQELSHRRITLTACPGRIPLVEQRVLSQLTLLRQSVKRLSRRTQIACLEALDVLGVFRSCTRKPVFVHSAHLTVAVSGCRDEQWHDTFSMKELRSACPHTRSISPMGFLKTS